MVVAIDKTKLYEETPTLSFSLFDIPSAGYLRIIQPAVNFDMSPLLGLVWLMAKGPPQTEGNYQGGALLYRRLQWSNGSVAWKSGDGEHWQEVADAPSFPYRDYSDLDGGSIGAPQMGGPTTIALGPAGNAVGSHLSMAVIRDGALWTCHHVGVDGVDGDYDGDGTGSTVDRSAIQWCRLHITGIGDLELQTSTDWGRIWEPDYSQQTLKRVGL